MKRLFGLLLILVLLGGCGEPVPEVTEGPLSVNFQIVSLDDVADFGGFTASAPGQGAEEVRTMVETALSAYPEGLLAQLGEVRILLVGELTGDGPFAGGGYAGFTQRTEGSWRMVLDVSACHPGTVHHELGHILDSILTAAGRLPEAQWLRLNPPGFSYGSGDWEGRGEFFVDTYAMTALSEDRASVFEAAVMGGEGIFDGKSPLWLKLHAFSDAIRAHFDTTGWPQVTIWELALH